MTGPVFAPFAVGSRFRVVPSGTAGGTDDRIDLVLRWGAFGSGEHETTASCLELLEDLPTQDGWRVLDVGCGTGVLTIAALALGAATAVAFDIAPGAVENCRENLLLNGLAERVRLIIGELDAIAAVNFDLVVANIYGDILLALAPQLMRRARPGAHLVLSGILWEDLFAVRTRYLELGCSVVRQRMMEEYASLHLVAG